MSTSNNDHIGREVDPECSCPVVVIPSRRYRCARNILGCAALIATVATEVSGQVPTSPATRDSATSGAIVTASVAHTMLPDTLDASVKPRAVSVPSDSIFTFVVLIPKNGPLATQLKIQVTQAEHMHRTPIIEVGATWCAACHQLEEAMRQPGMREAMRGMYVIHIDADRPEWAEEGPKLGIDISALPTVMALDHNGRPTGQPIVGYATVVNVNPSAASLPDSATGDDGTSAAESYGSAFAAFRAAFAKQ